MPLSFVSDLLTMVTIGCSEAICPAVSIAYWIRLASTSMMYCALQIIGLGPVPLDPFTFNRGSAKSRCRRENSKIHVND